VVPSGNNIIIDVYGWFPAVYPYCSNVEASSGSAGYLLGSKSVNLSDSQGVSVPISYVSGTQAVLYCNNPPQAFDVQPRLTDDLIPEDFYIYGNKLDQVSQVELGGASTSTFSTKTNGKMVFSLTAPTAGTYSMNFFADDGQSTVFSQPIITNFSDAYLFIRDLANPGNTTTSSVGSLTIKNTGGTSSSSQTLTVSPSGVFSVSNSCILSPISSKGTCNESITFTPPVGDPVGTKYSATVTVTLIAPANAGVPNAHSLVVSSTKN
jgi:hypothetical protein